MQFTQSVTLSPHAMFQQVGEEGVILDLATSTYFGLDRVGTRVWQLLQSNGDLAAAHAQVLREFDVGARELERDLMALLDELFSAGLAAVA